MTVKNNSGCGSCLLDRSRSLALNPSPRALTTTQEQSKRLLARYHVRFHEGT